MLTRLTRSKTDEELLALAADQGSLIPEARDLLANELARRDLRGEHWKREFAERGFKGKYSPSQVHSNNLNLHENPAFNTAAKIAYLLVLVCACAFVIGILAEMIREWAMEGTHHFVCRRDGSTLGSDLWIDYLGHSSVLPKQNGRQSTEGLATNDNRVTVNASWR